MMFLCRTELWAILAIFNTEFQILIIGQQKLWCVEYGLWTTDRGLCIKHSQLKV